jgi:hypothetical protein
MELLPNELAYKPLATKKIQLEGQGLINDISFGPLETDAKTLILKLKNPNDDSPGIILKELKLVK